MTDQEFCRIYSAYYGDGIDKIGQLVQTTMDGEELKELIEFFIKELKTNNMEFKGTKGYVFCYFNNPKKIKGGFDLLAPTFSQAFRWFRENYNIQSSVKFSGSKIHYVFEIRFQKLANGENTPIMVWHYLDSWLGLDLDLFSTYEEAELACLTMLIEIVESKSE